MEKPCLTSTSGEAYNESTKPCGNMIYLTLLWGIIYCILVWTYGNFHFLTPRHSPEAIFSNYVSLILILLLLFEFTLNFPVKYWYWRLLSAFAALFLIGFCMPTF